MMKSKQELKKEALEREKEYSKLSSSQKVIKLDLKLGGGVGAVKQRAKIAKEMIKESEGRVAKTQTGQIPPGVGWGPPNKENREKKKTKKYLSRKDQKKVNKLK